MPRLKQIATFLFNSIHIVGPDLTNDMYNEKHLPSILTPHQQNTVSVIFILHVKVQTWNKLSRDLKVCTNVDLFYSNVNPVLVGFVLYASIKTQCMPCRMWSLDFKIH